MAEGVELALGAMVLYGLSDWVYKHAAGKGVRAHQFLVLQSLFLVPGIFLYGLATGTLALGATGAVSVVAPVFRLSFAITVALAVWLLDERFSGWKLAGLAATLTAFGLLLEKGPAPARRTSGSAVFHVTIATVAMGLVGVVYKLGLLAGGSPATVLAAQASVFLPLSAMVAFAWDGGLKPPPGA